ncbi:ABC-2 type transport system permease protein [Kitasatospora sp. MAP12-15]|uniref:ABC transporter permease n=1 Tax=unclassified Kitasatospora TaxID=2633591 RepID=UPI0024749BC2|nr:ABC transporter permease [Kitasatospora sp. MAP12-44]MDH6113236.1 ABC-2 type transport system permease protein [Kitasatospora sp. MAP12-44]
MSATPEKERASAFLNLSRVMIVSFVRDRMALFFVLLMPLIFLVMFGFLFKSSGTSHLKVAQFGPVQVLDELQGQQRAGLDSVFTITKVTDEAAGLEAVKKGTLDALIEDGPDGQPLLHFSASDQVKAGAVQNIMNSFVQSANQDATGQPAKFRLSTAQVEDNALKPIQFLTPGLLGWAIASGAIFGASLTLVNWRKKRVLRRLRLAPVSAAAVVGSRVAVSLLVALAQTAIFLVVATTPMFGLKLSGNWWLVVPLVLCATIAFMSIGLVTGSFAKTEEAANGINQLVILPMSFLSGSFFPLDNSPGWLQGLSKIFPLHYLVTSAQSVLTRGGGLMDVLPAMGGLLAFAAVMTLIASRFFSWDDA